MEFKLRGESRFDMAIKRDELHYLHSAEREWLPLVAAALGQGARLVHLGCFLSLPNSELQAWHSDGDHMSDLCHLPPHALNVFIALDLRGKQKHSGADN